MNPRKSMPTLRVLSDAGHLLEWQEGRWQRLEDPPRSRPLPATPVPFRFPEELVRALGETASLVVVWEAAKVLAVMRPRWARNEAVLSWDYLHGRGADPILVLQTADVIRGAAIERYVDSEVIEKAVRRLLRDAEAA